MGELEKLDLGITLKAFQQERTDDLIDYDEWYSL